MTTMLDIAEIARATGLSSRALRFYEARGLIRPLRSEGGRRIFGAGELERLHAIVALKRALRWRRPPRCSDLFSPASMPASASTSRRFAR